jgi:hypothetical protein
MIPKENMLCLIRAKACKRCGGDLSLECDVYGVFIQCIQCGATFSKDEPGLYNAQDIEKAVKVKRAEPLLNINRQR